VRASILLAVLVLSGCGYSEEDLQNAYREGHRAGIIWCKRLGTPVVPELDEPLLARWRDGWRESTSIQCPKDAADVSLAVHPAA
jgi:hypothetical protein